MGSDAAATTVASANTATCRFPRPRLRAMVATLTDAARMIIDDTNTAVLATINPDGTPQTSPVWIDRDGDDLLISTAAGRRKDRNLRRDPRAGLCVFDRGDTERYVEVRGTATVTVDEGRAFAVALAEKYEGPGAGQAYLDLPPEVVRVIVRITPTHVVADC